MKLAWSSETSAALPNSTCCQHPKQGQHQQFVLYLELSGLVRNGVSVGGGQLARTGLSARTAALPFHPRRLVQVNLAAYCPGATLRQVIFAILCKQWQILRFVLSNKNSFLELTVWWPRTVCYQCFGKMSPLHLQTINAVRAGKKVSQVQGWKDCGHEKGFPRIGTYLPNYPASHARRPLPWSFVILVTFVTNYMLCIPVAYCFV